MPEPLPPSLPPEGGSLPSADDLFTPTLLDTPPRMPPAALMPWRLSSQLWVAFLGGVLPVTCIAYLNAGRLGLSQRQQRLILGIGCLAMLIVMVIGYQVWPAGGLDSPEFRGAKRDFRLASRIIAVGCYLIFARIQAASDRRFQQFDPGDYASLWRPGLVAVIGLGAVQGVLLAWVLLVRSI